MTKRKPRQGIAVKKMLSQRRRDASEYIVRLCVLASLREKNPAILVGVFADQRASGTVITPITGKF